MLWRFRRSGGEGAYTEHTKPFSEFPVAIRRQLIDASGLTANDVPVLASRISGRYWVLLTTERLLWCTSRGLYSLPWSSLDKVGVPAEDSEPVSPGGDSSVDLCRLRISTFDGQEHELEFEPGPPFVGFSNTLAILASANHLHRP